MNKMKLYGLMIISVVFTVIGHFKVSASFIPNGNEMLMSPSVLTSISTGVLLGGFVFFVGMALLAFSLYEFVREK